MSTLRIIAYDITDDRRRNRVARLLEGYGERVQDSVFECWLENATLRHLQRRIRALIDFDRDKVRYYSLCRKDHTALLRMGRSPATTDREHDIA